MSKLLINEPPLMVLPTLAKAIGLNEAIVIQQIHYWLEGSSHSYDGRRWVYNTAEGWQKNFPFWSEPTIRRILTNLREQGLVVTGNYNKAGFDRTLWYSIEYEELRKKEVPFHEIVTACDQLDQMDTRKLITPIPETTTKTTTERGSRVRENGSTQPPPAPPLPSEEKASSTPSRGGTNQRNATPFLVDGMTAGELATQRGLAKKYCSEYDWNIHRPVFEAIVDIMGVQALVDADDSRVISDYQDVAVILVKAGQTAETVNARKEQWLTTWPGKDGGSLSQLKMFLVKQSTHKQLEQMVKVRVLVKPSRGGDAYEDIISMSAAAAQAGNYTIVSE